MTSLQPTERKIEHLEDFTAHEWCNKLLSDTSVTQISKRQLPDRREGVTNTFFTRTLFTDEAVRAFISLYKPGEGHRRKPGEDAFTGTTPIHELSEARKPDVEARRQSAKEEKIWDENDPEAPEAVILVSLGRDLNGGINRLHGGVTATLLDMSMGTVITYTFEHRCATSEMTVKYKQPIMTPCILLCRGKIVREKGRWIETRAWLEDGQGKIFGEASGVFVMNKITIAKI